MITSDGKAMSTTPRTDEAARQGCYLTTGNYASTCGKQIVHIDFARQLETELNEAIRSKGRISQRAEAIRCDLVETSKQLAESKAREAQLREFVKGIPLAKWQYIESGNMAEDATKPLSSQPAPPVVPLADLKPLLDALDQILTPMSKRIRDDYSIANEALATFTAKHPTP